MYKILEIRDRIRVSPDKFSLNLEDAVKTSLEEKLEGSIDKNVGVILSVLSIEKIGEGVILAGDGALYYPVEFKILAYLPEQHELVKGDVIDVTEFGVFVRMGPVDGMVHVSQLMDDFVSYDSKNLMFTGKKTKRRVKEKSQVMARVISVSMIESQYKIGLTTRQPGLGALEWYKKEEKRIEKKKVHPKKKK
ncbi:MAG: DNA-directed RNA polymerase [Candidatus Aenigmarchaeota archaeon]|nr:DNA-directed RNA polymerase [Candidatus Aenigmarchaeota archaeon]NIP40713.1 DNA-directed RNA polymerase [Candidatus Aenigmarchaeota archaeon]NIQ18519.1 DNA-directed RNA polymerase [Candidatus Aenigmarchaeota archaeon]NIS73418.1 DNA-directed RNA polymerase [Candidatus Aenigmarchaeota archaeon]